MLFNNEYYNILKREEREMKQEALIERSKEFTKMVLKTEEAILHFNFSKKLKTKISIITYVWLGLATFRKEFKEYFYREYKEMEIDIVSIEYDKSEFCHDFILKLKKR